MQTGKIRFPLFGLKFLPWAVKIKCPQSFAEMTISQLAWWAENVWSKMDQYFQKPLKDAEVYVKDENQFILWNLQMVQKLTGVPTWLFRQLDIESRRNIVFNYKLSNFLYSDVYAPEINPISRIGKLHGPSSVDVLVPWEFSFVDVNYLRYKKTKEDKYLVQMLAHLYRKKNQNFNPDLDEDKREKFIHHNYSKRKEYIEKRSTTGERLLVLYWYESWRNTLPKSFKYIFNSPSDKKVEAAGSWLPVFQSASGGIHNFETIKYMNLLLLLSEINRQMKLQKELESKINQSNRK